MPADTPSSREIKYGGRQAGKTAAREGYSDTIATRRGHIPNEQHWLSFKEEPVPAGYTTRRVSIWTADHQHCLGIIQWNNGWRRYAFEPCFPTVFEQDCLKHIAQLLEEMTVKHKADKKGHTATVQMEVRHELHAERLVGIGEVQDAALARTSNRGSPRNAPAVLRERDFFPAPSPVRHDDETPR